MNKLISEIRTIASRRKFVRQLTKEEHSQLKEQINNEGGINTPIDIDQDGGLLDGHNRLAICKAMGLEEVPVIVHNVSNEKQAEVFMAERSVGRRNLTNTEYVKYVRVLYESVKGKKGAPKGNTNSTGKSKGKKDNAVDKVAAKLDIKPSAVKAALAKTKPDGSLKEKKDTSIIDEAYKETARAMSVIRSRFASHPNDEFREWVSMQLKKMAAETKDGKGEMRRLAPTEILNEGA